MKMRRLLQLGITLAFLQLFLMPLGHGQSNEIEQNYRNALRFYEDGNIDSALFLVEASLRSHKEFADAEKSTRADIFWLGMQSCLLLKRNIEARMYLKRLLALRPQYQVSDRELEDVGKMYSELVVKPRLSVEIEAGALNTWARVLSRYFTFIGQDNKPLYKSYDYSAVYLTPQFGAHLRWRLGKHFSLAFGASQATKRFSYQYNLLQTTIDSIYDENDFDNDNNSDELLRSEYYSFYQEYKHRNSFSQLEGMLSLRTHLDFRNHISLYAETGVFSSVILGASKRIAIKEIDDFSIFSTEEQELFTSSETVNDVATSDLSGQLVKGQWGWMAGAGVSMRLLKRIRFNIGLKYMYNMNNLVKESQRYESEDIVYGFYDISDNYTLRSLGIYGSWELPISFKAFEKQHSKKKRHESNN